MIADLFKVAFLKSNSSETKPTMNVFCDIELNSDTIYPGQNLTGNVEVSSALTTACTLEQIIMEVLGEAECKWTYNKHLLKPPRIYRKGIMFSDKQQFFVSRHTLAGSEGGHVTITTTPRTFQFKTFLPIHLPATWKGEHGLITYTAKVLIKELNKPLHIFREEIKVCPYRDLKLEQHLLCEARQDIHRNFRYAILSLGSVDMSIWLPLCGIAAGQSVPLLCTITNKSSIQFGGLIFVLTQLEIYRSKEPTVAVKTYRRDICRIPRMVDILHGKYEYYCLLETDPDVFPTNQFGRCHCCQLAYEVWVSLQGAIPRYNAYGYPNIDTPGIPLIVGTEPLCKWDSKRMTGEVMAAVYDTRPPVIMEPLPPDDDIEEMLNYADEEMDAETERNLARQMVEETVFQIDVEDNDEGEVEQKNVALNNVES